MNFNIFKILKRYHQQLSAGPIYRTVLGFILGMFLGLLPFSINSVIILILIFALRNDKITSLLSALLFGALSFVLDYPAHSLGLAVLQAGALQGLWTYLYNLPFMAFTGFNNSLVMGNTLIGLILTAPSAFLIRSLLLKYRGKKPEAPPC